MNVGIYNATTLVRTEVNHFANEATALSYEECEVEKYEFIATLDSRTSGICQEMDNKVFKLSEKKTGINFPPLHPNCRSTTVPKLDNEVSTELKRRAREKNGESILVPADMNYKEWKAKYIDITEEEKGAIGEYSSSKAYTLNEKLRNGSQLSSRDEQLVKSIDGGLSKLPNYNKTTYRQIGFDFQGEEEYNNFINYHKNNKLVYYNQYLSTSKNYNDYEVTDKLKVEITIDGKTGKDIRGFAGIKEENEVLFKRDVGFKVLKVEGNKIRLKEV